MKRREAITLKTGDVVQLDARLNSGTGVQLWSAPIMAVDRVMLQLQAPDEMAIVLSVHDDGPDGLSSVQVIMRSGAVGYVLAMHLQRFPFPSSAGE